MQKALRPFRLAAPLAIGMALVLLLAPGCGEDASPTVPAPAPPPPPAPDPPPDPPDVPGAGVTAAEVTDRDTLKFFVERAATALEAAASDLDAAYTFLDETFRPEGEWRHGEVYVFVLTLDGINFFQAPDRNIEGKDRTQLVDLNGTNLWDVILAAAESGEGFTEYWFDNPAVEGDEETGSPKLAYVQKVTIGDTTLILGSGIYLPLTQ